VVSSALASVADLLQVPKAALVEVLRVRRVKTANDTVATPLTVAQVRAGPPNQHAYAGAVPA
jgi:myosin heavy subunit